jgi:hypothetical protein
VTETPPEAVPRLRGIIWRLLWLSALGGIVLAVGLALAGVGVAGGGADLFADLLPAVAFIGLGMAIPPVLGAVLAVVLVGRPPRARRREQWAAAVGGVIGAFVSPVLFYSGWALLGIVVALIIALVAGLGYPLVLRSLWKRAAASG